MIEKSIKTDRGNIYYWVNGNNSSNAIVFLHGLTADHTIFDMQIEFFSKDYKVVTVDLPLHGKSVDYKDFSIDNAASDLAELIKNEGISKYALIGQSAGGYFAQQLSKIDSKAVCFIGVDTSPLGKDNYKKTDLFWVKHFRLFASFYPYNYYCKVSSKQAAITSAGRENMYNALIKLGRENMLIASDKIYNSFATHENVELKCPVLLVCGDSDKVGYVKKYNKLWHENKNYPIEIIPNAGHNSNYDNYGYFNEIVKDFIEKIV